MPTIPSARFTAIMLILAPVLFSLSTFFWHNGEYQLNGSAIMIISMVFWVPVMFFLFGLIREKAPVYYHAGLIYALYGCVVGGPSFGYLAFFADIFAVTHEQYLAKLAEHSFHSNIILFWAGPAFPVSILVLAIVLIRFKVIKTWIGILLIVGAIAFPVSRISRIVELAHLADIFLCVPLLYLGIKMLFVQEKSINVTH